MRQLADSRPHSPACSLRTIGAGMTDRSEAGASSPSNSTSRMRVARFSTFSAEIENLPHVLVRLAEMLLQAEHALVQPPDVVHEVADLGVNLVGRLAHAGIPLDLLDRPGWRASAATAKR